MADFFFFGTLQDGEEENGYARDAEIGQGVAEGKFEQTGIHAHPLIMNGVDFVADDDIFYRRGRASGRNIRDEPLLQRHRMVLNDSKRNCTNYMYYSLYKTKTSTYIRKKKASSKILPFELVFAPLERRDCAHPWKYSTL